MDKPFNNAALVGRFQLLHMGHELMIDRALELSGSVNVYIGSAQESGTEKNPLTFEERKRILELVYRSRINIYPLPDAGLGNNPKWGEYVLKNIESTSKTVPDLFVTGRESRREAWFDCEKGSGIYILSVPKTIEISSSQMKKYLVEDKKEEWKRFSDSKIWGEYSFFREKVLSSINNRETNSI